MHKVLGRFIFTKKYSLRFDDDYVLEVGGVLLGDVFVLEVPIFVVALDGCADGVVAILVVDGIDGFGKCGLFLPVDFIEEVALNGIVGTGVP